jgi:hypothetical protein
VSRGTAARSPLTIAGVGVGAALTAAVVLAACSSPSTSAGPTTTTTTAAVTTTTHGRSTSTTGSTAAGTTTCQPDQLQGGTGGSNGAAGTLEIDVTLTNTSSTGCTLYGYPGMQLLTAAGDDIPTVVIRGGVTFGSSVANQPAARVILGPSQTAAFTVHYEDVPVGNETTCPTSASAAVTPPNDYSSVTVSLQIAPCGGGTVHVSPVYAGTG